MFAPLKWSKGTILAEWLFMTKNPRTIRTMAESSELATRAAASSQKIAQVLTLIQDDKLRSDVDKLVRFTFEALAAIKRIHLPQDHFEEGDTIRDPQDKHVELAPYVLSALASTNQLLAFVASTFPLPQETKQFEDDDDFDFQFDLVDGPTGEGVGLSQQSQSDAEISPREQVTETLGAFAGMLRTRVVDFGKRLKFAVQEQDRWPLLAELDDAKHRLTKALQAVLFGVLGIFAADVRREEVLPAYRSAVAESVGLRSAVTELSFHFAKFNMALSDATPDLAVPLVVAMADHMARFSQKAEYRSLRADDKKATIEFRSNLHMLRHSKDGLNMAKLQRAVEGFSKFLEAMSAINHREILLLHDRQRLQNALAKLQGLSTAGNVSDDVVFKDLHKIVSSLDVVMGRHPELDQMLRSFLQKPPKKDAKEHLQKWTSVLETTFAMVR